MESTKLFWREMMEKVVEGGDLSCTQMENYDSHNDSIIEMTTPFS